MELYSLEIPLFCTLATIFRVKVEIIIILICEFIRLTMLTLRLNLRHQLEGGGTIKFHGPLTKFPGSPTF